MLYLLENALQTGMMKKSITHTELNRRQMVLYFLQGCKAYFAFGIICSLLAAFLDMTGPKVVQYTVDMILGDREDAPGIVLRIIGAAGGREYLRGHIYVIAVVVLGIAVVSALSRYLYRLYNAKGAEQLIRRMRDELFDQTIHLPLTWHGANHTGDIIQRCTSDVETIKNFLSEQLMGLFRVGILIAFGMYFMFGINVKLACISGVFIPVVILYSVFFHNRIAGAFLHADEEEGKLSAIAQENLTGVRVVRAFGREQYERERFETKNHAYTLMWIRLMGWLSAFWCSNDFISGLQILLVTVFGAVFCVRGQLSVGEYIAFVSYNGMLSWPVRELGRVISDMSKTGVSLDRVRYIMNSEREVSVIEGYGAEASGTAGYDDEGVPVPDAGLELRGSHKTAENFSGADIVFDHVSFSYDGEKEVLHDISFRIPAGTTLGILGATGSGKSTIVHLLNRLYELPKGSGSITIDGRDIRSIELKTLRRYVGEVLQEPYLFSGTIAENIGITTDGTDEEVIRRAIDTAALDETMKRFADGDQTYVGERGVTLSGGQKQRTAIARLVAAAPPVMVFDDSLSAVDTQTDARIRKSLKDSFGGKTVILISHRINTIMGADNIIVLNHGRIAEQGTHRQLLEKGGLYSRIYDIQTEGISYE